MVNKTPEQRARDTIDRMLRMAGWAVQDMAELDFSKSRGIAVREYQTGKGRADYVLFADSKPCGVIEAKKEVEGQNITTHELQTEKYATGKLKYVIDNTPLPFLYQSTGTLTHFTHHGDPKPRATPVFQFHRPETLAEMAKKEKSLRARLQDLPPLPEQGLRRCQIKAIVNLEKSIKQARPRALIQMATGSGKTYTAITFIYRLLKFCDARRVLFLVDTKNLGEQAEQEFMAYTPSDDNRKFTELYNVRRLNSSYIPPDSQVCISTIQRLYSILRGEDLDESAEQENPHERTIIEKPREVVYNETVPMEFFDFIVIDEAHRSIYNVWRQVLEYFDAFHIGLTATPDKRTFGFFNENIVSEYTHEEAVADGVNVNYDVYTIETDITKKGGQLRANEYVDRRNRLTRKTRWTQLDEDVLYSPGQMDREVVVPSQIRHIIRAFKDALPEIFPGRQEVPKTLIFAKTDSHADDIIKIVREEFAESNEFCRKITYNSKTDPKKILASFRNDYYPRISVTVDMIATGTDVKPLECLLFMRDVRSRNYFEQMKGRGTRTLGYDDLKKVTPSVHTDKTHFVIIDAVGVTKSVKTDSRPLERKKSVKVKDLLYKVMMGADDEDTLNSLAGRLARLNKSLDNTQRQEFQEHARGKPIHRVIKELLDVNHPDRIEEQAREMFQLPDGTEPGEEQKESARQELRKEAASTFNGKLNTFIENTHKQMEQILDRVNIDRVTFSGWDKGAKDAAASLVTDFKAFIQEHRDEITALKIFYNRPYSGRDITYAMIKELLEAVKANKPYLAPLQVWQAYERLERVNGKSPKSELSALVSLVRRVMEIDEVLTPFDGTVDRNFQDWVMKKHRGNAPKFNKEQMEWLRMIKEYVSTSFHIDRDDMELPPFDSRGGLGRMHDLFGDKFETLMTELNEALSA